MYNTDAPKALNEHITSKIMRKPVVTFQIDPDRKSNMHAVHNNPHFLAVTQAIFPTYR